MTMLRIALDFEVDLGPRFLLCLRFELYSLWLV